MLFELLRNNKNKINYLLIRENPNYYEIFPEEREVDENITRRLNERYQLLFNINNEEEIYFESDVCDDIELMEKKSIAVLCNFISFIKLLILSIIIIIY